MKKSKKLNQNNANNCYHSEELTNRSSQFHYNLKKWSLGIFGLLAVLFSVNSALAQYEASPAYYTSYFNEALPETERIIAGTSCDIINYDEYVDGRKIQKTNYAIAGLNVAPGPNCGAYVNFYKEEGVVAASSVGLYSLNHGGTTKIKFSPEDPDVFYILYEELDNPGGTFFTYIKRFEYTGSPVLSESARLQVFNNSNSSDIVVAPNGDVIIVGVDEWGQVKCRVVRSLPSMYFLPYGWLLGSTSKALSANHEASIGFPDGAPYSMNNNWKIHIDMKGDQFVIGHTRGSLGSPGIRLAQFSYFPSVAFYSINSAYEKIVANQKLVEDGVTSRSVGIRTNGEVFYTNTPPIGSSTNLSKLDATGTTITQIFTGMLNVNDMVVSDNGQVYVTTGNTSMIDYTIRMYNEFDAFEHEYDIHSDLDYSTDDISVAGCKILATGHEFFPPGIGTPWGLARPAHQLFSCDECDGGDPHADFSFLGSTSGSYGPTYYGPKHISNFCDKDDIIIDGSASTCENSYWLKVQEIDPITWTPIGSPVLAAWIDVDGEVPNDIQLSDYLPALFNFNPFARYLLTLTVGQTGPIGPFHSEHKLFSVFPGLCSKSLGSSTQPIIEKEDFEMSLFPNPTSGLFTLYVKDQDLSNSLKITNLQGQITYESEFKGSTKINLEGHPAGIYLLDIQNTKGTFTKRVVLK